MKFNLPFRTLKVVLTFLLVNTILHSARGQEKALWLRYPSISPDGSTILFNYKGDIYSVPSSGGTAQPLTVSSSFEYGAIWSNDGKTIAFSSNRFGNFDIFVMPSAGGEAMRLTYHSTNEVPGCFSNDDSKILFSAVRQDVVSNVQYPTGLMSELYEVPVKGGRVSQVVSTPMLDPRMNNAGNLVIFHDLKGYENLWRKHHTSAVTHDIWTYDLNSRSYTKITNYEGEDRNPVFDSSDVEFYYLSEKSGSFNVYKRAIAEDDETNFLLLESIIHESLSNAKILHARNGIQAIEYFNSYKEIDLIFMDIKMPELSGLEVTRKIREKNKALPVIAQSAYSNEHDKESAIQAGCNLFICKPLDLEEINEILVKYLNVLPQESQH